MSNITCYIQDTTNNENCNIDLDVNNYSMYQEHIVLYMDKVSNEKKINDIFDNSDLCLNFILILEGSAYFECKILTIEPFFSNYLSVYITFKSKQNVN